MAKTCREAPKEPLPGQANAAVRHRRRRRQEPLNNVLQTDDLAEGQRLLTSSLFGPGTVLAESDWRVCVQRPHSLAVVHVPDLDVTGKIRGEDALVVAVEDVADGQLAGELQVAHLAAVGVPEGD